MGLLFSFISYSKQTSFYLKSLRFMQGQLMV